MKTTWPRRVDTVDAGRGFMMFIQVSHGVLLAGLGALDVPPFLQRAMAQLSHEDWHGLNYIDLGFPGYIVIMAMAVHLVVGRARLDGRPGGVFARSVVVRVGLLLVLGVVYNGGLSEAFPEVRLVGVLQRIGLCYGAACLVAWHLRWRGQCILLAALLLGYWALLAWVPFPGATADRYGAHNLVAYVDELYLPGRRHYGRWDPEGLLSTVSAVGTAVFGLLLGRLFSLPLSIRARSLSLVVVGVAGLLAGLLWGRWFPINKHMWTSSYVLATGGAAALHVLMLYLVGEVWGLAGRLRPLRIYGRHSLVAYMGDELIPFADIAQRLVGGSVALVLGAWSGMAVAFVVIALQFALLYWLDRQVERGPKRTATAKRPRRSGDA